MESQFAQIVASYHRARRTGQLFDTFYELFLAKSPEIPPMFARTDFPHQKLMLRESILEILYNLTESSAGSKWARTIFPWFATILIYVLFANLLSATRRCGRSCAANAEAP